ncbi:hypothetical protein T439DRAFT_384183, partial [Meredithblackwellia eburnea MCA 4105]
MTSNQPERQPSKRRHFDPFLQSSDSEEEPEQPMGHQFIAPTGSNPNSNSHIGGVTLPPITEITRQLGTPLMTQDSQLRVEGPPPSFHFPQVTPRSGGATHFPQLRPGVNHLLGLSDRYPSHGLRPMDRHSALPPSAGPVGIWREGQDLAGASQTSDHVQSDQVPSDDHEGLGAGQGLRGRIGQLEKQVSSYKARLSHELTEKEQSKFQEAEIRLGELRLRMVPLTKLKQIERDIVELTDAWPESARQSAAYTPRGRNDLQNLIKLYREEHQCVLADVRLLHSDGGDDSEVQGAPRREFQSSTWNHTFKQVFTPTSKNLGLAELKGNVEYQHFRRKVDAFILFRYVDGTSEKHRHFGCNDFGCWFGLQTDKTALRHIHGSSHTYTNLVQGGYRKTFCPYALNLEAFGFNPDVSACNEQFFNLDALSKHLKERHQGDKLIELLESNGGPLKFLATRRQVDRLLAWDGKGRWPQGGELGGTRMNSRH